MRRVHLLLALSLLSCAPDEAGRTAGASTTAAATAATDAPATTDATTSPAASTTDAQTASTTAATTDALSTTGTGTTGTGTTGPDAPFCPPEGELDCSPGPGSGEADTCFDTTSCFLGTVQAAIKTVLTEHPEWFMHDDKGDYVLEVELYMDGVVAEVAEAPLCAIRDPNAGDEIAVKHDDGFAENFDILTAEGYVRAGDGIFTGTCAPAWF